MTRSRSRGPGRAGVVIVGAGGNIGSHLGPHVARIVEVGRLTLIDPDLYEAGNLTAQMIDVADVGRPKAVVQAAKLRRLRRDLIITPIVAPVAAVPLGRLRADVILACLDSRRSRQDVNRAALRLGIPWIDAGVDGTGLLARVSSFRPGPDYPCFECSFSDRDYELQEQIYSCLGEPRAAAATRSPSSLGALAASLQAIECRKLLTGQENGPAFDHQILIDAAHHRIHRTRFAANPECRLVDHAAWRIEPLRRAPAEITLAAALSLASGARRDRAGATLGLEESPFITRLVCSGCGGERSLLRHRASLGPRSLRCSLCRARMTASGFDMHERLAAGDLPRRTLGRSLGSLGLRVGDVFCVGGPAREKHYELTA